LIGYGVNLSGISDGVNGNQIGVETPIDPMLGPLQDNGGPTTTHAPLPGSPLIDAGSDAKAIDAKGWPLLTDQRGFARFFGTVDIGAVEAQPPGIPVAYQDGFVGDQDNPIFLDVLANDFCNDGSPMTAVIVDSPSNGVLEENPDGTWTYTPEPGFWGVDVFTYQAANCELLSNTVQVFVSVLSPTNIIVTTADDEMDGDLSPGDISLREALAMAGPGSTIQFSAALLNRVIKLTYSSTATLSVANVQIVGLGAPFLTIDGNSRGTVFQATAGDSSISHLTVTGGSNSGIIVNPGTALSLDYMNISGNRAGTYGGGIHNNRGTLTLTHSHVLNNSVTVTLSGYGGGIHTTEGATTVVDSIISGNSATRGGGGIRGFYSSLTLVNSIVSGNKIDTTTITSIAGAGVDIHYGSLTAANATISGNTMTTISSATSARGIGIWTNAAAVSITDSTISNNTTNYPSENGHGIVCVDGTISVVRSTISGNSNGGMACQGLGGNSIVIDSSTISGNSGAGLSLVSEIGSASVINSTIVANQWSGIALAVSGTVSLTGSTIAGNSANYGGGINVGSGTLDIANCTISGNSAGQGGGINVHGGGSSAQVSITNSTITANSATSTGGGVYVTASWLPLVLHNTIVAGNNAPSNSQLYGTVASDSSHNLIGFSTGLSGITNGVNGNQIGVTTPIDPMLGPLQDNGGPTRTHEPLPGSPLIDAGSDAKALDAKGTPLLIDQRGFVRFYGTVDIGAVESQPPGIPVAHDDGFVGDQDNPTTLDLLANDFCNDGSPMTAVVVASPAHGVLEENPDGTWTYTPESGFWGVDVFTYQAANGELLSNTAQVFVSVLSPTSIIVTTADDEMDGNLSPDDISLREALALAGPGSTIQFSAALLNQVIRLTYSSSTATLPVANVQIVGLGAPFLTIDANSRGAAFQAISGESLVSHLTVTGGTNSGIIVGSGTSLSIDGLVVRGNRAGSIDGGGIRNQAGTLTVANSTIFDNLAMFGGGIYSWGPDAVVTITDSTVRGNSSIQYGGGLYNGYSSTMTVVNSRIADNRSDYSGGGIYTQAGTLTLVHSTISGNTTGVSGGQGGGLYVGSSLDTVAILNSVFVGNTAMIGGGVYAAIGSFTIANSTIA
ncbi:MAG: cadherin-like domain-containing protein, partial [Pirellulaceae bacterium]|nr:cadherin-like domain-containing protein [Pirellulaceae bacterium]